MATIYKRGASWYLNDAEATPRLRRSLGRITEAEAQEELRRHERGLAGQQTPAGPLFALWAAQYAEWHATEYPDSYFRVEQILRQYLIPHFGQIPVGAIVKRDVEAYKLTRKAAAATVAKELRTLQACINKAVEWDIIPVNRARGVKPPRNVESRPPRWYTVEELQRIYAADPLHIHWWRLLANTGLRRGEAQALRWENVGEEAITVVSETEARTKSARWRLVPITPGARLALEGLKGGGRYVLPRVEAPSMSRAFAKALARLKLDGNLHCLRHTYCSHLVMGGVDLRTVQVLAGHSTIKITERYAHLAPGHLQAASSRLCL